MDVKIRILVVDDDEEVRLLLSQRLPRENERFEVDTVSSGEECLEYLKTRSVDCIVSDYQMPGMDGVELLDALRESGNHTPFIFFTGQGNQDVATHAFKSGAFDYFTKDLMSLAKFARIANSVEQAVKQRLVDEYRVQAERELIQEKRKLEDIMFNMGVGLSIHDRDYIVTYQNSVHERIVGGNFIGEFCYKAFGKNDSVCEDCQVRKTFEDGETHRGVRNIERAKGPLAAEMITAPIYGQDGTITSCIQVVEELQDFKAHEDALRHSERKFRSLFDGANDAIFLADAGTGEIIDANIKAAEMLGRTRESILGMHQADLHPADELARAEEVFRDHAEKGSAVCLEIGLQRADGGVIPVEISASSYELGGRKVIQGMFREITDRLKADEDLRESESRYREAEDIAGIGSWEWDVANDKVRWSDGMFRIFGVSPHNFGKTYQSYLDFVVPEEKERVMGLVAESLKGEAPLDYVTRFFRQEGEERYLYIYGRVTLDGGRPVRLFGTAQDITDKIRYEQALEWELSLNRALSGLSAELIDRTSSIEDIAESTLDYARALTASKHGFTSIIDRETGYNVGLTLTEMMGNECTIEGESKRIDFPPEPDGRFKSLWGHGINSREPFFTNEPYLHETSIGTPEGHVPIKNFLAVPAMIGDRIVGMIALANKEGGFTREDLETVGKLAEFYSLAVERMQSEDDLRGERSLLKTVLGAMPDIVFIHERDGSIVDVFHQEGAPLYRPKEEFIGRPLDDVLPPDVAGRGVEVIAATVDNGEPQVFEYALDMPGGGEFVFEARVVPFGDGRALSVVRDVTVSRKAQAELRSSEARFRQLADNIDGALWMTSADRKTVYYAGQRYRSLWGMDPDELVGDYGVWLNSIHPDDRPMVEELLVSNAPDQSYKYEYRIVRSDGEVRWIRDRSFPIFGVDGEVYRLAGIAEDITEEKALQKQREDLFSMLRHDVRTPLSIIAGNAEILADEKAGMLDEESIVMLRTIQNNAKSLSRMLDDMAAISRLEAGTMPLAITETDVSELVLEVCANMVNAVNAKSQTLVREVDKGLPMIRVDRTNVLRALTNLLQNAVNYTQPNGGISVGAHLSAVGDRKAVAVTVKDNGPGIADDELPNVFEKRFRGRNSAGVKGSGLGLAIVKLVAETHGGKVEVESGPGNGCTFRICFPV